MSRFWAIESRRTRRIPHDFSHPRAIARAIEGRPPIGGRP
jgi:hypothetical protein